MHIEDARWRNLICWDDNGAASSVDAERLPALFHVKQIHVFDYRDPSGTGFVPHLITIFLCAAGTEITAKRGAILIKRPKTDGASNYFWLVLEIYITIMLKA